MKNLGKLFGIIAIVAIIGFSLAACNDNPFVGKWSGEGLTVTCTDDTWTAVYGGQDAGHGTYTPNGDKADFIQAGGSTFGTATVSGDTMTVNVKSQNRNYKLKKQ